MAKKIIKNQVAKKSESDSKLFAFLAVLLSIIGFIIALVVKKEDKYVMFYAKQSLILFIAWIIAGAVSIIPLIGWFISPILYLIFLIFWIISLVYSVSGEEKETPFIGKYARGINL